MKKKTKKKKTFQPLAEELYLAVSVTVKVDVFSSCSNVRHAQGPNPQTDGHRKSAALVLS